MKRKIEVVEPVPQPSKAGLYYDVPFESYLGWPAIGSHDLIKIEKTSPADYKKYKDDKGDDGDDKDWMVIGTLTHILMLEPKKLKAKVLMKEKPNQRTERGRDDWKGHLAACRDSGILLVTPDQMTVARSCAAAGGRHAKVLELLGNKGKSEVSVLWRDAESGLWCKARIDYLPDTHEHIVDLKTAQTIEPRRFRWAAYDRGYHVQRAFYSYGLNVAIGGAETVYPYWIVAIEKPTTVGYAARAGVFSFDERFYAKGVEVYERGLRTIGECTASGEWPEPAEIVSVMELPREPDGEETDW